MKREGEAYNGYRDLKVYQMAYQLALDVQKVTESFPKEEKYSLTDQIKRSSRSVPANLAEAWKKRMYRKMFVSKIIDAAGEAGETEVWLDFSKDFGYLTNDRYQELMTGYDQINRMLYGMVDKSEKFCRRGANIKSTP